jgi:DNA-binding transcriptional ArsR family regulator
MVESLRYDLDLVFQALADPTRRAMLKTLSRRERAITEVAKPFRMSLAAVSKHVKVLERAKLVHRRREGSYSYLSLNSEAMMSADQWMEYYRQFWSGRLGALKQMIEKDQ